MKQKYRIGQKVWIMTDNGPEQETVLSYEYDIKPYELSDGQFYDENELFKTKKDCEENG